MKKERDEPFHCTWSPSVGAIFLKHQGFWADEGIEQFDLAIKSLFRKKEHPCKDCGIEISKTEVRCDKCKKANTRHRKYQRRHEHRKKLGGLK